MSHPRRSRRRWLRRMLLAGAAAGLFAYRQRRLDEADRAFPPPPTF